MVYPKATNKPPAQDGDKSQTFRRLLNGNALRHSKGPLISARVSLLPAPLVLPEVKRALGTSRSRPAGTKVLLGQGDQAPTSDGCLDQPEKELGSTTCMGPGLSWLRQGTGIISLRRGGSRFGAEQGCFGKPSAKMQRRRKLKESEQGERSL